MEYVSLVNGKYVETKIIVKAEQIKPRFIGTPLKVDKCELPNPSIVKLLDIFKDQPDSIYWQKLLRNPLIKWTPALFNRYIDQIKITSYVSGIGTFDWLYLMTTNFISDNIDHIDWYIFSYNSSVPWTYKCPETNKYILIERYKDKIHWSQLIKNTGLTLDEDFMDLYGKFIGFKFNSPNNVGWTHHLLNKYGKNIYNVIFYSFRTDWTDLIFDNIPPNIIQEYINIICRNIYLSWNHILMKTNFANYINDSEVRRLLCGNPSIEWTKRIDGKYPLVERCLQFIDWPSLIENTSSILTVDFIETYKKHIDINYFIRNPNFVWTDEHIRLYSNSFGDSINLALSGFPLDEDYVDSGNNTYYYHTSSLCNNKTIIWGRRINQ